ncbi:hypothetical protein PIB30_045885 [Stylosanthes scabra]|uniref:Uncharacterized protein n=1 Tax=Stylosanthes scabra TaxID=79078 RepID=A0ABU6SGZ4_9FABA|nr:hypothetical protein [Stylosanthes scabra]
MAAEAAFSFSVASVVEDVLQQHGTRLKDLDFESRKAEEAASRRYEAAGWLRKMVGVVAAKDLPAEPSEEEFRLGLRSGIILCNVINKVQSGAVPKVVESPVDSALIPDGAPLSAYQYFENVRNFLVAVQEIGIPTFEASDLEQGGKSSRIVNCVLGLKSYGEWKQSGANGVWKFGGNLKPATSTKSFVRKNSEPFTNSLSRTSSLNEKSVTGLNCEAESNSKMVDKRPEEVPMLVESVLSKVVEEFEHRIASRGGEQVQPKIASRDPVSQSNGSASKFVMPDKKVDNRINTVSKKDDFIHKSRVAEQSRGQLLKQKELSDQQQREIQELKHILQTTKAGMQFIQMKFQEEFSNLGMHVCGLAHAASGYHRVLEENRKLYNQVQDLKGSIRVYCRVRPFFPGQPNQLSTVENIEDGTLTVHIPSKNGKGRKSFNFNKVFGPSASQAEVFLDMQPLIRSVLDGFNVCIFAYGQTGSGKTYTMTGPKEITEKSQGVNYRALKIRSSSNKGLSVPDASLVHVSSTLDVIELMSLGQRNRAVGATALNDRSSRSHSCLTVHVQGRDLTSGTVLRGCMHLVDLAGSERVDKSEATGDRLKEAQHINKSLSALGDVIASLAQKNSHVPYRNSKLTQLLQDSLGGQAKTLMFVHISPESEAIGETLSTLKFAERVATVELGAARVNKDSADVKELKEQIANLKAALARKEGESEHSFSGSSEKYRTRTGDLSPYHPNQRGTDAEDRPGCRQPMVEVGNIGHQSKSRFRHKTQSLDFDEMSSTSPPWPPVSSPGQHYAEDDKETGSGEWVDKVMVNKQDINKTDNLLGCWESPGANGNLSDVFYQKYLQDSSKMYSEQSYNMFMGGNQFNMMAGSDEMDELDAATSDSSEPDLLWQFNHSKLTTMTMTNAVGSKTKRSIPKSSKSPEMSRIGASVSNRTGRHPAPVDARRKVGNRK